MCSDCDSEVCKVVPLVLYRPSVCDSCGDMVPRLKDAYVIKLGRLIRSYACESCAAEYVSEHTGETDVEEVTCATLPE